MTLQPIQARAVSRDNLDQRREQPSDLLTTAEINAQYLRYRGAHWLRSVYRFIAEHGIRTKRRSRRCLLVKRQDILRALDGGIKTVDSASPSHSQSVR